MLSGRIWAGILGRPQPWWIITLRSGRQWWRFDGFLDPVLYYGRRPMVFTFPVSEISTTKRRTDYVRGFGWGGGGRVEEPALMMAVVLNWKNTLGWATGTWLVHGWWTPAVLKTKATLNKEQKDKWGLLRFPLNAISGKQKGLCGRQCAKCCWNAELQIKMLSIRQSPAPGFCIHSDLLRIMGHATKNFGTDNGTRCTK